MSKKVIPESPIPISGGLDVLLNDSSQSHVSNEIAEDEQVEQNMIAPKTARTNNRRSQAKAYEVKTSLYLDESLFIRAKHYCADYRMTLTELVNKSLLIFLKKAEKKAAKEERRNDAEAE